MKVLTDILVQAWGNHSHVMLCYTMLPGAHGLMAYVCANHQVNILYLDELIPMSLEYSPGHR